jgi:predicted phage terminase large subunit-like protein
LKKSTTTRSRTKAATAAKPKAKAVSSAIPQTKVAASVLPANLLALKQAALASMVSVPGEEQLPLRDLGAIELVRRDRAASSFIDYIQYTMPTYEVHWHHRVLAEVLELVVSGQITRLMVFEPPRHGKSEQVSVRLPAYYIGKQPEKSVIGTSYALDLALSFSRAARNVFRGPAAQRVFSHALSVEGDTHWQVAGKADERLSYIAAGVGGGITGEGANLFIIDDPLKNYQEALSQVTRDSVWNWITSTARTRLASNGAMILTMTRWHEDDPAGRFLRLAQEDKTADQWVVLELPAQNDGEFCARLWSTDGSVPTKLFDPYAALWETKFDAAYLKQTRATLGTLQYSALYGASPRSMEGNIIKREWFCNWYVVPGTKVVPKDSMGMRPGYAFNSCEVLPPEEDFELIAQSWDMAFKDKKTSDFVAAGCWGKIAARRYLLDRLNEKLNYPNTRRRFREWAAKWPMARIKWIEDAANGPAIISELQSEIDGIIPVPTTGKRGKGSKDAALSAASPTAESGNVILPHPSQAPWVYDFIECLCAFPNGLHDDEADQFSQAINKMRSEGEGLLGLWKQNMRAAKKEAMQPVNRNVQPQEQKDSKFNRVAQPKGMQRIVVAEETVACPQCGSTGLARFSDGRSRCNQCGINVTPERPLVSKTTVMGMRA